MAIVKVSWSGGKDSTCALHMHLMQGDYVKAVCYIPMFTKDIPLILKDHYEFILSTADKFRKMGAEVYIVSGMTYYDFVIKKKVRGGNKGQIIGFPCFLKNKCNFKDYSKKKAINKSDVGNFDFEDFGIAYDEKGRQSQLTDKITSILVKNKVVEQMALDYCQKNNILSPNYQTQTRDGCALCPQKKAEARIKWFEDYPQAFDLLLDLQNIVKKERPEQYPLRNKKFFIEEDLQMDIFSDEIKYKIN